MFRRTTDRFAIDTHNWATQAALRAVVLLAPLWFLVSGFIVCGLFFGAITAAGGLFALFHAHNPSLWDVAVFVLTFLQYYFHYTYYEIPLGLLSPAAFIMGWSVFALLIKNKLVIQEGKIKFPPPNQKTFAVKDLVSVSFTDWSRTRPLWIIRNSKTRWLVKMGFISLTRPLRRATRHCLSLPACAWISRLVSYFRPRRFVDFRFRDGKLVRIAGGRLSGKRLKQLAGVLETRSPDCSLKLGTADTAIRNETVLEIHYQSHRKLWNFFKLVYSYEKYFWRVYVTLLFLPLVVMFPYIAYWLPLWLSGKNLSGSEPGWLKAVGAIYQALTQFVGKTLGDGGQLYYKMVTHPAGVVLLVLLTGSAMYSLSRFLMQPNSLRLGPSGLKLQFKHLIGEWSVRKLDWQELTAVTLDKPKGTTSPEQWRILIKGQGKECVPLKLDAIPDEDDRRRLLSAIERWAPQASLDPELIQVLMPSQKKSYTELWLQSLSAPPKRERLSPLDEGHELLDARYVALRQLGVGGQGVAYLARFGKNHPSAFDVQNGARDEYVVLKEFILPVFVDKKIRMQALERFENEAQVLQRLDHPQIVRIIDFFVEDHRAYLVLEHIDGISLRDLVEKEGKLPEAQVRELAFQMCDILEYLHGLAPPLVHRDFTPDNLILHKDGTLKLIDFNVAQQRDAGTATSTVVGKHAYLPPEQFRGKPTIQSDLYAMGGTLQYLLTGSDPEPLNPCHPILSVETITEELDAVVCRLTQLDLKPRYACALDVKHDLASHETSSSQSAFHDTIILDPQKEPVPVKGVN